MKPELKMNRVFFAALGMLAALSSCQSSKVKITGRFVGSQADMVYLEQDIHCCFINIDNRS